MSLDEMLERWRQTRSPVLADEIEELTQKEPLALLAHLWRSKVAHKGKRALQAIMKAPDDPRITVMLMKCLYTARWPGSGARPIWLNIFERLIALRDTRAIAPLRDVAANLPHFTGVAYSKVIQAEIAKTADALEKACVGLTMPKEPSPWLARKGDPSATSGKSVTAVWAKPDDDETRLVIADALMESGDPWGEFITLGFKIADKTATEDMKERAASLLHKHAPVFGGPIAHIATKDRWVFEKGFLLRVSADRAQVPRRRWEDAAKAPHWATVRELVLDRDTPRWWITEVIANPMTAELRKIEGSRGSLRLERSERDGVWMVHAENTEHETFTLFTAIAKGLDADQRAKLCFADDIDGEILVALEAVRYGIDTPPAKKRRAAAAPAKVAKTKTKRRASAAK